MSYRTPIVTGDRVALAPHTDLWMAGCRFGEVTDISEDRYRVAVTPHASYWLTLDSLLGAVGPTASEREGATLLLGEPGTGKTALIDAVKNGATIYADEFDWKPVWCSWCDQPATHNLDTTRDQCCAVHFVQWFSQPWVTE